MSDETPLRWNLTHDDLLVVWVRADDVAVGPTPDGLSAAVEAECAAARDADPSDEVKTVIRDLLRGHGYKPSGRGKPASEFLRAAAKRDRFPSINNVVDINNLVSLQTGWPISIFDLDRAEADGGAPLEIRLGAAGERFVFNAAGQEIDIGGLVIAARADGRPIGNPVKDSMATKLDESTRRVLAVLYGSRRLVDAAEPRALGERFATLLREHAGADSTRVGLLPD